MRYHVRHLTRYTYAKPPHRVVQALRLTPRAERHQAVRSWRIEAPGELQASGDAHGNPCHLLILPRPEATVDIVVGGEVEIQRLADGVVADDGILPPLVYAAPTELTRDTPAVRAFCDEALPRGLRGPADALELARAVCARVRYEPGVTDVSTRAERVLELGHGVCQDHAHVFLACARTLGVPARYVSGYLMTMTGQIASHAWVDVHFAATGWHSVDVTHQQFTSDEHCRLAVALDYGSAAPVRGVRRGGGAETLHVEVTIHRLS